MLLNGVVHLVGILYLFYLLLKLTRMVVNFLKTSLLGGTLDFKKFGEWAVVTGCTDGIGKAYAKQLAAKGLNIVLMSRSLDKLETVASEIRSEYGVQTKIIQIDFSGGHEIYDEVAEKLEALEIGVLVNNVGMSQSYPEFLGDVPIQNIWGMVNVNVMAMTMITRLILPSMAERRKGVIINISSSAGNMIPPLLTTYAATKSYMNAFSSALASEYDDQGIIVQCVNPFFVSSKMSNMKPSFTVPTSDDYVRAVLKKVGVTDQCFGYWPHELLALIYLKVPASYTKKQLLKMRDRILRKKAMASKNQ